LGLQRSLLTNVYTLPDAEQFKTAFEEAQKTNAELIAGASTTEAPSAEEPKTEKTKVEESKAEESKSEEPTAAEKNPAEEEKKEE
jgi:Ran-binding protein 1